MNLVVRKSSTRNVVGHEDLRPGIHVGLIKGRGRLWSVWRLPSTMVRSSRAASWRGPSASGSDEVQRIPHVVVQGHEPDIRQHFVSINSRSLSEASTRPWRPRASNRSSPDHVPPFSASPRIASRPPDRQTRQVGVRLRTILLRASSTAASLRETAVRRYSGTSFRRGRTTRTGSRTSKPTSCARFQASAKRGETSTSEPK